MPWRDDKFQPQQQAHKSQFLATIRVIPPHAPGHGQLPAASEGEGKGGETCCPAI